MTEDLSDNWICMNFLKIPWEFGWCTFSDTLLLEYEKKYKRKFLYCNKPKKYKAWGKRKC